MTTGNVAQDEANEPSSPVCYVGEFDPTFRGTPEGVLEPFGRNLWYAEGPVVPFLGFPYPTRMAVMRLDNGELVVWSPIKLTDALRRQIDGIGKVAHLTSPNAIHHLYLQEWTRAYPDARLYGLRSLMRKRRDLPWTDAIDDAPQPRWLGEIAHVVMHGSIVMTEVVFFHRPSGTAIFGDLIENFPRGWFRGWKGLAARLDGIVEPKPGAPREWRLSFLDRRAARRSLAQILAWPIERVIVAHGRLVATNGHGFVAQSFSWLDRRPAAPQS